MGQQRTTKGQSATIGRCGPSYYRRFQTETDECAVWLDAFLEEYPTLESIIEAARTQGYEVRGLTKEMMLAMLKEAGTPHPPSRFARPNPDRPRPPSLPCRRSPPRARCPPRRHACCQQSMKSVRRDFEPGLYGKGGDRALPGARCGSGLLRLGFCRKISHDQFPALRLGGADESVPAVLGLIERPIGGSAAKIGVAFAVNSMAE